MSSTRRKLALFACCCVAACAESTGPPLPGPLPRQANWLDETPAFAFSVFRPGALGEPGLPVAKVGAPEPEAHEVSFWAYQDRDQSVLVRYQGPDGGWLPYVELVVPQGALFQRPGGSLFSPGDSIQITLTIDSTALRVQLEPSGLAFSALTPAWLTMWYTGADPDFDGNGTVDLVDAYIEQSLLGLWVQASPEAPWEVVVATQSLLEKLFAASLPHFSGYEVAW